MWKKLKALFTKKKPQLIIYHVHEGPMHVDDIPDIDLDELGDLEFCLLCKVEIDGVVFDDLVWFETLEEALLIKEQFKYSIAPVVLDF